MNETNKTKMIEDIAEAHAYALAAYNAIDINNDNEVICRRRRNLLETMHHLIAARSWAERINNEPAN